MPIQKIPLESIRNQPNGLAGIDAAGKMAAPLRDRPNVRDWGAVGTGNDDTSVIQAAIDAASSEGLGELFFPPAILNATVLRLKNRVAIVGAGINSTSANARISRINFTHTSGSHEAGLIIDKPFDNVQFAEVRGILLTAGSAYQTIIKNTESHWFRLRDCYISGTPSVAAVWLGATLYTKIEDNVFSLQGLCTAIDASEENYDITYYGTNFSVIRRNSIFNPGAAVRYTGVIEISENNVESGGASDCDAKLIMVGPSSSPSIIRGNYFEIGNLASSGKPTKVFLAGPGSIGSIIADSNYMGCVSSTSGSVGFDLADRAVSATLINNTYLNFDRTFRGPSSAASITRINEQIMGSGNGRPAIAYDGLYYSPRWVGGGNAEYGSWRIQDGADNVRFQVIDRTPWQEPTGTTPTIFLRRGQNIAIGSAGATVDRVNDAGLFPGAVVTILARGGAVNLTHSTATAMHSVDVTATGSGYTTATATISGGGGSGATADVVLQQGSVKFVNLTNAGSGYTSIPTVTITGDGSGATAVAIRQAPLMLAKGASAVLPSGRSIQFVVDMNRRLSEIGDYTVRL
jgi:hypothetical protein